MPEERLTPDARPMRLLIVTDAWHPQINGVVRTLQRLSEELVQLGVQVEFITPEGFYTVGLPSYPDIRLALILPGQIARRIETIAPTHIHIATEGPLGVAARRACIRQERAFTTSYHTRFPEYMSARWPFPEAWSYRWLRRFHNAGYATLVAAASLRAELSDRGFLHLRDWNRGVDTALFHPDRRSAVEWPRPVFLSVGRIAVEKNLPAFLDLDLPGTKLIVGDGPDLSQLRSRYRDAVFLGPKLGEELADLYASSDVFVFPSRTDTFGNVMLEAIASGTPVAAFPVTGPIDIFADGVGGSLSEDLRAAALVALELDRVETRKKALEFSWAECAAQFLAHVLDGGARPTVLAA